MSDIWIQVNKNVMAKPKSLIMEVMLVEKGRCISAFLTMENIYTLMNAMSTIINEANGKRACLACEHHSHREYQTECCDYYWECVETNKSKFVPKLEIKTEEETI